MSKHSFVFSVLFLLTACTNERLDIPAPKQLESIQFYRLDKDLAQCKNQQDFENFNAKYLKNIGELYAFYTVACLRVGHPSDSLTPRNLSLFANDQYMKEVNVAIAKKFPELPYKETLEQAFGYLKHYFPKGKMPQSIVYYNSAFTNSVVASPKSIGIGLERYLGKRNKVIKRLSGKVFFDYIKEKMDAQFMTRDAVFSWVNTNYFEPEDKSKVLIERVITLGKVYYITEACLPNLKKFTILRFDDKDFTWANLNEGSFWRYLVEQNVLFKRNTNVASNILNNGPFTPGLPTGNASPARLGHYLGWKMVKQYMDEHPEVTLEQLITTNYKQILKSYKPFN